MQNQFSAITQVPYISIISSLPIPPIQNILTQPQPMQPQPVVQNNQIIPQNVMQPMLPQHLASQPPLVSQNVPNLNQMVTP